MHLHERAQFDFLLNTAAERFAERLIQRNGGMEEALGALREDPQGDGVWLDEFVRAVVRDFLLDNPAGSAWLLQALAERKIDGVSVADRLSELAVRAFADVLALKVDQGIEIALSGHQESWG